MLNNKISAPAMVYISGEEMTREVMKMVRKEWVEPYMDTSKWQEFDLSCKHRDETKDQVLKDTITAGAQIGAIFKEPTITPNEEQAREMGLSKIWGSPNGAMRKGWNGYSIDRDTIAIPGIENMRTANKLGYKKPVLFCRHAVGGEYHADYKMVGPGRAVTMFYPADGGEPVQISERTLSDKRSALVVYDNPLDNVEVLAHHFFKRSLDAGVVPYVVTKQTVFKWQQEFWKTMKKVYDEHYKDKFVAAGLVATDSNGRPGNGDLEHLLSDNAVMQMAGWTDGGFSMVAHNYDGDILTDLQGKIYKSPGLISSVLTGVDAQGRKIMEFEASHGTDHGQYLAHLKGQPTSHNPMGMVYALRNAIDHSVNLAVEKKEMSEEEAAKTKRFTSLMYEAMCEAIADSKGTKDLFTKAEVKEGKGATTEEFIAEVSERIRQKVQQNFGQLGRGEEERRTARG